MARKSIYDQLNRRDFESLTYRFRSTAELELEREERKLAIKLLRRRDNILKAVQLFTERFLRMPLTESSIEPILETLGHATEVSRVYIFENATRQDGTLVTSQRYEWVAPGIKPQIDNPDLQELPWQEAGFKRWVDTLGRNGLIYGHVSDFPNDERKILSAQEIISVMAAPIFVGNQWWGFIGFDDCHIAREWSPVEIEALKTAANVIGAATQRKQAEDKIRTLNQQLIRAQENERNRIAGYLHDHVAQDLSSLKIGLETLFDNQGGMSDVIKSKIDDMSQILQESITTVRDLSYDLHPSGMDQLGLMRTVYQYCNDFSEKNNVSVDFYTAGMKDLKLDFDTEINLYRLIQEGLNNIKKHAEADHVTIRIVASSPNILLRIEDNGKGFEVERRLARSLQEKRMGLFSMEERVSLLNGTMDIKSQPSKGTRIFIEVPCKEKRHD